MPLAVNDIVQVTVLQSRNNQQYMNVYHYRCSTAPSTGTPAENVAALIDHLWQVPGGTLGPLWQAINADDTFLNRVRGQVIHPTRAAYVEHLIVSSGNIDANQLETGNLAWVFVKQSEFAGRRGKGTTHMIVPASDWMQDGNLDGNGQIERDAFMAEVDDVQTVAAGGTYEPVIFHPGFSPAFHRITHTTQKPEIRTMSRRTVGRGI